MATRKRVRKSIQKSNEPDIESLAKDERGASVNRKRGSDSAQKELQGTISTYVREQILKDSLAGVKDMKRMKIVNGRGGKDLELFSQDLASGYEKTAKDKLINEAKKEIDSKGKKRGKVLLKKVSEDDIY